MFLSTKDAVWDNGGDASDSATDEGATAEPADEPNGRGATGEAGASVTEEEAFAPATDEAGSACAESAAACHGACADTAAAFHTAFHADSASQL